MIFGWLEIPNMAVKALPRGRTWSYAKHEVIEGPTRAQFVADGAPTATMTLFLHASFCNPKAILDALDAMGDEHEAQVLQEDGGVILGQYVVEAVNDRPIWKLPDGTLLACEVDLQLSDPGLDTALALRTTPPMGVEGNARETTSEPKNEDMTRPAEDFTPAEIARV